MTAAASRSITCLRRRAREVGPQQDLLGLDRAEALVDQLDRHRQAVAQPLGEDLGACERRGPPRPRAIERQPQHHPLGVELRAPQRAMASRSRWPPWRAIVACGCAVSPSPSVTATPMRRVPRSMPMTLRGTILSVYLSHVRPAETSGCRRSHRSRSTSTRPRPRAPTPTWCSSTTTTTSSCSTSPTCSRPAPRARVRARIISSPRHTKRLLRALEVNLRRYEERFGRIEDIEPQNPTRIPTASSVSAAFSGRRLPAPPAVPWRVSSSARQP